jgi:hypothetical protein
VTKPGNEKTVFDWISLNLLMGLIGGHTNTSVTTIMKSVPIHCPAVLKSNTMMEILEVSLDQI